MRSNLFDRFHRLALGENENFLTEGLAVVLESLIDNSPEAAASFLRKLTFGAIGAGDVKVLDVDVQTQLHTSYGKPDIVLSTAESVVVIEVKVGADTGYEQLDRYRKFLEDTIKPETRLLILSPSKMSDENKADYAIRWIQVGDWIRQLKAFDLDGLSEFFIDQYTEFLLDQGLMFRTPKSKVSEFLKYYIETNPNDNIFDTGAIRSLERLEGVPELIPLRRLLISMRMAVENVMPSSSVKVGAGKNSARGGGWIGLNIDSLDHFFVVYLNQADIVTYEAYDISVDPSRFDGYQGAIVERDGGKYYWMRELDLTSREIDFYDLDAGAQIEVLEDFLRGSLETASDLSPDWEWTP